MPRARKYPEELLERGDAAGVRVRASDRACRGVISGCPRRRCASTCARSRRTRAGAPDLLTSEEREEIRKLRQRELRAAPGERDLEGRVACFSPSELDPTPTEVSAFIDEHRDRFGVEPICQTLGVSASAYYQRATGERSARAVEDERLLELIREIHAANYYAYGYRRMWKALLRAGEQVGARPGRAADARSTASRAPSAAASRGARPTPDPAALRPPGPRPARLHRRAAGRALVRGLHLPALLGGRRVLRFVIDAYSRRIVGWQFASHMRTDLVLDALRMALAPARSPAPTSSSSTTPIAGSQYTSYRLHPDARRPRRARLDRIGRRRLRQRARRELRRQLQDRADRRPRLAHPQPARARDRRVRRLVQQRAPARSARRPATAEKSRTSTL